MIEEEKPRNSQDDKIVGALAHAAALLPMWGIIAPVLIWVTQREKSEYIRQQSAQALAWQLLQIVLFFIGMGLYMGGIFLTVGTAFLMDEMNSNGPPPAFFIPVCILGFVFLIFLGSIGIALYAAVRNLQGHDFTYPLIGRRVRAYLAK